MKEEVRGPHEPTAYDEEIPRWASGTGPVFFLLALLAAGLGMGFWEVLSGRASKIVFIRKADAICERNGDQQEAVSEETRRLGLPVKQYWARIASIMEDGADRVRVLERPPGFRPQDEEIVAHLLHLYDESIRAFRLASQKGLSPRRERVAIEADRRAYAESEEVARKFGFESCFLADTDE